MKNIILTILLTTAQVAFAAETANPELSNSLKDTSHEPNLFSIVFALGFVVFLIYITGLIYSKLNIVGAKAVKEQLKNYELTKAVVLSTTQLGQGKNLHVIEVNKKCYLIGATPNSINLIKELGEMEAQTTKKEEAATNEVETVPVEIIDEFDVHKKYL